MAHRRRTMGSVGAPVRVVAQKGWGCGLGWRVRHVRCYFFFSSRRRHTRLQGDWSSDVCSSDLKQYGTIVSYDLNYRPSLWKSIGGQKRAQEVNKEIAKHVDVMIGNEEDFTACLGFKVEGADEHLLHIDVTAFKRMIETAVKTYPNFKATATTLRAARTATINDWAAIAWMDSKFYESRKYPDLEILDRVGGGDSFASGFIYGLMTTGDPQKAVDYGAAHGALAMTTPGDTSMASKDEVEKLVKGGGARVQR